MKFRRIPATVTPGVEPFDGELVWLLSEETGQVFVGRNHSRDWWQTPNFMPLRVLVVVTHYAPLEFEETDDN